MIRYEQSQARKGRVRAIAILYQFLSILLDVSTGRARLASGSSRVNRRVACLLRYKFTKTYERAQELPAARRWKLSKSSEPMNGHETNLTLFACLPAVCMSFSQPESSNGRLTRTNAHYDPLEPLSSTFVIEKNKNATTGANAFRNQYASVYFSRLMALKHVVKANAERRWKDVGAYYFSHA